MNPIQFIVKWNRSALKESAGAQQHFLDLCDLLNHPKPAEVDSAGDFFTFEKGAEKMGGGEGWADVWKRGFFAWEYKGKHRNLESAYRQLQQYREALENPPLMVVSDMDRIIVHTNFTNTPVIKYEIPLLKMEDPANLAILRAVFFEPETLKPGIVREAITTQAAAHIGEIAQALRDRGLDPHKVARFLDRIVFCLFAEDVGLLPEKMFSRLLKSAISPQLFSSFTGQLFETMAHGGYFGIDLIRHFNGNLFDDAEALTLTRAELDHIRRASLLDWGAVDPSIFGTLFERGLDPDKRSQLGAHYTSRADIETLVEPVVMQPLRREWDIVRAQADSLLESGKKKATSQITSLLHEFIARIANVKVLDPACGSGNFLYVTLQKLKDLEKEVSDYAVNLGSLPFALEVGPWQLYGIEVNPYAYDLAQMTVWIGYLQWTNEHGYLITEEPILRCLDNFKCMDAIIDLTDLDNPKEPEWPEVDYVVGNPPFLGDKLMRGSLGDDYVDRLRRFYGDRIPGQSDLCCYWFEKARDHMVHGGCSRAGLLATQGIRGGANREVLARIKQSGDIFFAVSDRAWILDGANVHVSMVGFDDGSQLSRHLNGLEVDIIHTNLNGGMPSAHDVTTAQVLPGNAGICYLGAMKAGAFDITDAEAEHMLIMPNPNGKPSSDVLRPRVTAKDILQHTGGGWLIDFGCDASAQWEAYELPWEHVVTHVKPKRLSNRRPRMAQQWWLHGEPRPGLRKSLAGLRRFIVTPEVSKHRVFAWLDGVYLADHQTRAFARSDDYFFGVLHSRLHEVWARAQGTQLRERESGFRYTPTTCFETFPLPEPTPDQEAAIAEAARQLNELRENWLNPPEWMQEEILEFPGSMNGPWARYLHDPDQRGIGTVRYPRTVPRGPGAAQMLAKRTLTNLYNQRPTWLDLAHKTLDEAVFGAYGWEVSMTDDQILERLLELNLGRGEAGR